MIASEAGNLQAVKYFIKCGLPILYRVNELYAIDFAYKNLHFDVMLELLEVNSRFPTDFDPAQASEELKKFINLMNLMHEAVESNDSLKVSQIIQENSHLNYFFNTQNETAIGNALKLVSCDVYEVLMLNHLNYNSANDYILIIESLSDENREKIRQINFKHTRKFGERHIIALMGFSTIVRSKDGREKSELLNYVLNAFNVLDGIPRVKKILEISSHFKNLQIVFDFENESLQFLDPTAGPFDTASFYHNSGQIAIAAKGLLDINTENIVIGALAHELCHLAIFMTFENLARPYHKNDLKSQKEFEEILKFCEVKKIEEQIIEWVFNYDEKFHHIELAVRVVHIISHYHNQPEKVEELEESFEKLFKNFNEKILPKVEEKILKFEGREEKIQKKVSLLWKIISILLVLLPIGILSAIYIFYSPSYSWSSSTLR